MSIRPKTIEVSLPARPVLLRRLARLLENEGETEASLCLQDRVVEACPDDLKARLLQYDMYLAAGQESAATHRIRQAWVDALENPYQVSVLRRLLRSRKRLSLLVDFEKVALEKDPADVRAILSGSQALHDSGDISGAQAWLAEFAQRPGHGVNACKRLIEGARGFGREELLDVVLGGLAAGSSPQLAAWLARHDDGEIVEALLERLERLRVPGWNSIGLQLERVARMEASGRRADADRAYARIESAVAVEREPLVASPTASTLMFRNMPLLSALVAIVRWQVERHGRARIHVAACSTGEEVYSLVLLLDRAGLLEACDVLASDFDPKLVRRARTGVLAAKSMASVAPDMVESYFARQADGRYRMDRGVLSHIAFRVRDLRDAPKGRLRYDLVIANNILVHYPEGEAASILATTTAHVEADGVLCVGGGLAPAVAASAKALGLSPLLAGSEAIHEAWRTQRSAWYRNPRPYWALPPARHLDMHLWRRASLFARSEATATAISPLVEAAIEDMDGM